MFFEHPQQRRRRPWSLTIEQTSLWMKRRRPGRAAISVDFSYPRLRRGS